jgi:hypothetical protein
MRQICSDNVTDEKGFPLYPIGVGSLEPGGVSIFYRNVYINPNSPVVEYCHVQGDETWILYHKPSANHAELAEILRQMRSCKGNINICNTLRAVTAPAKWGSTIRCEHIVRFDKFLIGMGCRMYKNLYKELMDDKDLFARVTTD